MEKQILKRSDYIGSCDQLMTVSCILAGFAFSGLIALPSLEKTIYDRIVHLFQGNFEMAFYASYYFLFFSTLCFLSTILTILVYKATNYLIPIKKLKRIYLVANLIFSVAVASLLISVVAFAMPTILGLSIAIFFGVSVSACFIWENMVPWQRKRRLAQLEKESGAEKE